MCLSILYDIKDMIRPRAKKAYQYTKTAPRAELALLIFRFPASPIQKAILKV